MKISARETVKESEIKKKIKECFKNCATGRQQLRVCVSNSMNTGLSKEDVLAIINEMGTEAGQDEASLCSIVAIGQAMRYEEEHEEEHGKNRIVTSSDDGKKSVTIKLQGCIRKCGSTRKQLRKCVANALDAGLSKEEILAFTDEIVGGIGKDDVSLCGIIAADQVLRYEEAVRKKPIDILKEREME